ncbi:MAG TPA: hypothetical protein VNM90_07220 [Haliangium sp.]|nr:hypothetical protein [Haliangium sp.]
MSAGGYSRASWAMLGLLGAAVIVTLLLSWQIRSRAEQVADALEAAPLVAIASFPATGYARIEGRARLLEPALVAPLSGRRCAYYELDLELPESDDAPGGDAGRRRRMSQRRDFELTDATGKAVVRMHSAVVAIGDAHCRRGSLADVPANRRAALAVEEDLAYLDSIDPAAVRFRECALPADAQVAVAGVAGAGRASPSRLVLGVHGPSYVGVSASRSQ